MENRINEILDLVAEAIRTGAESLPPLAQETCNQLVALRLAQSCIGLTVGLIILAVAFWCYILGRSEYKTHEYVTEDCIGWSVMGSIVFLIGGAVFVISLSCFFKAWLAPNVYVLEFIKQMTN